MKKWFSILLSAVLCLALFAPAMAAQVRSDAYSDAPATPTQENVLRIEAEIFAPEQEPQPYALATMLPTQLTVDTVSEIFDFVEVNLNPPARYFPQEVQEEIREIISGDPDILYMPEFMSLLPEIAPEQAYVQVDMHFDIDYEPGRLVVVVLGWQTEEGICWKALDAQVAKKSLIRYDIPADVLANIAGKETLFALLSVRPGSGWQTENTMIEEGSSEEEEVTPYFVFSKSFEDVTRVEDSYIIADGESDGGREGGEDCQIIIVKESEPIRKELELLQTWLADESHALMAYFDEEIVRQCALLLPKDVDANSLIAYELTNVQVVGYDEPYGDVAARFTFITPFTPEQSMVSLLGMPEEGKDTLVFTPLHTQYVDDLIEITFSSTVLPAMMQDAGLLLVISTPLE